MVHFPARHGHDHWRICIFSSRSPHPSYIQSWQWHKPQQSPTGELFPMTGSCHRWTNVVGRSCCEEIARLHQLIGSREKNLHENPMILSIFHGKIDGFRLRCSLFCQPLLQDQIQETGTHLEDVDLAQELRKFIVLWLRTFSLDILDDRCVFFR